MLSYLVYKSDREESCSQTDIDDILAACQESNRTLRITGVLLYSDTKFLQYLEGDLKSIMSLYDRIKTDRRHKNAVIIGMSTIEERVFPGWQMGSKEFDPRKIRFGNDLYIGKTKTLDQVLNGKAMGGNKAMELIRGFFEK